MKQHGFALITVLIALAVLMVLLTAYFVTTSIELATTRATVDSVTGFYAAEAGLNVRGEQIRAVFQGYNRPAGTSPLTSDPCQEGNDGTGDFACQALVINNRTVTTYVVEDPRNNDPNDAARMITIPPGERFAGLNAIQYRYSVFAEAVPPHDDRPEAILEMVFRSRLVPLFQFAAFYNKDLEILPGPNMTLNGRVHTNGDLYLGSGNTLSITGEITVSQRPDGSGGTLFRGRKNDSACSGTVRVDDGDPNTNPNPAIPCIGGRRAVPQSELDAWNGRIETGLETLTVPSQETFDISGLYWREADLRVALDLRGGLANARVIVPNREVAGGVVTENVLLTNTLDSCLSSTTPAQRYYSVRPNHPQLPGTLPPLSPAAVRAVEYSNSFRNHRQTNQSNRRESYTIMLEVDTTALLNCLHQHRNVLFADSPSAERGLNDTSGGGLVWYFTVLGPHANNATSGYGVRLRNSARLAATLPGAPEINGLTVVSDQAIYLQGDFNRDGTGGADWRPAAILADTIHILSNNWDAASEGWDGSGGWGNNRRATETTVNAAFLAATNTTGNQEGVGGQGGAYNGGLENYPWFHENWGGVTFNYKGSFVSLERPRHWGAAWIGTGAPRYDAPFRNWSYDSRFNDAANLPPLSPRFVYLVQERFVREFSR